ncbi:alpha/beta hydrolase [Candidatus Marimicrobium litorale]|nr:alpha/beta hydrolase [Candidatus Marimicrobium litorale]
MMKWFLLFLGLFAGLIVFRKWLAGKTWVPQPAETFEGRLLQLGENLVALPDRSHLPTEVVSNTTLICFPGFLEDMRYFLEVHYNTPARLVLIGNANYQNPFAAVPEETPVWYGDNPHLVGTIAHDAWSLNRVLECMTGPERVVLHGHSRGGAVILEAGRQNPAMAARLEAILEAAVVPKGRLAGRDEKRLNPLGFYLYPFVFSLLRLFPQRVLKSPMMWVTNATKDRLVASIPYAPRQYATAVVNIRDIIDWQARTDHSYYNSFKRATLYVGERDGVLWRKAMLESAAQSEAVEVIRTEGTDHFISLESPDTIRAYFQ